MDDILDISYTKDFIKDLNSEFDYSSQWYIPFKFDDVQNMFVYNNNCSCCKKHSNKLIKVSNTIFNKRDNNIEWDENNKKFNIIFCKECFDKYKNIKINDKFFIIDDSKQEYYRNFISRHLFFNPSESLDILNNFIDKTKKEYKEFSFNHINIEFIKMKFITKALKCYYNVKKENIPIIIRDHFMNLTKSEHSIVSFTLPKEKLFYNDNEGKSNFNKLINLFIYIEFNSSKMIIPKKDYNIYMYNNKDLLKLLNQLYYILKKSYPEEDHQFILDKIIYSQNGRIYLNDKGNFYVK